MNAIAGKAANLPTDLLKESGSGGSAGKALSRYREATARVSNGTGPEGAAKSAGASSPARVDAAAPAAKVRQGLAAGRHRLTRLGAQIDAVQGAARPQNLRGRLIGIEQQYAQLNLSLQTMPANAGPQRWIVLQQQMYSMSENIGTLSKMVSQASSGMKSMLQTQV